MTEVEQESIFTLDHDDVPEEIKARAFKSGNYPYDEKLKRKTYAQELEALQIELVKVQEWARGTGERIVVVFEGRDAAGKRWQYQTVQPIPQSQTYEYCCPCKNQVIPSKGNGISNAT